MLIALVALLGIGGVTILSVKSELQSAGQDRYQQVAFYAAESGLAVGIEFLRQSCSPSTMFSAFVEPDNVNPQRPEGILGNGKRPGEPGNPFGVEQNLAWYEVVVLNNFDDAEIGEGNDTDGRLVLLVTGHGPNQTTVTLEAEIENAECLAAFCELGYAQEGTNAQNSSVAACSTQVEMSGGALRSFDLRARN